MKKTIVISALTLFASVIGINTYAQQDVHARSGIRFGLNASNLYIKQVTDRTPRYGFHAGIFTQLPLIKHVLYLQPELSYTTKGVASAQYNLANVFKGENSFNLNYLELPAMLTIKLGNVVDLQAGPYAGYLLNNSIKSKGDVGFTQVNFTKNDFNTIDYGLAGGLNVYFGNFMVGARYNHGMRPIANSTLSRTFLGDSKNSAGQVSIGFTF